MITATIRVASIIWSLVLILSFWIARALLAVGIGIFHALGSYPGTLGRSSRKRFGANPIRKATGTSTSRLLTVCY